MSIGIGRQNIIILFWKQEGCTVSFLGILKWEPVTFILDYHRPFICSVADPLKNKNPRFYSRCPSIKKSRSLSATAVSRLPCCGGVWKVGDLGCMVGMREQDNLIPGSRGHDRADILYGPPQRVCGLHTDKIDIDGWPRTDHWLD
jgi:hypothetical protein